MFVPVPHYALVVPWFMQHRGQFSVLIHPNTGFEYEDHSIWASWIGQPIPLDLSIFTQGEQTNEFGRWRGDDGNPTCMGQGAVCGGASAGFNSSTTILCCESIACEPVSDGVSRCGASMYDDWHQAALPAKRFAAAPRVNDASLRGKK